MIRRRIRSRLIACVAVLCAALPTTAIASSTSAGAAQPDISTNPIAASGASPIKHVIIVVQSGHSFDNYFGTRPGVNGLGNTKNIHVPLVNGNTSYASPYHLTPEVARDGLVDTERQTQKAIDGGKMDGFVKAQPNINIGETALGYYDSQDIPYYSSLADRFTLFDNFFASSQGGSLPNRLVMVSGQSANLNSNRVIGVGISVPTIFDQLNQQKLSWKYYIQGYNPAKAATGADIARNPVLGMPTVAHDPRVTSTSQYFIDLDKGQLPAVSYITGVNDSERSPQDPSLGEAFVRSLINALMQSNEWSSSALLLTYDDAGGWYDHVNPPTVANSSTRRPGAGHPGLALRPLWLRRPQPARHRLHPRTDRERVQPAAPDPPGGHRRQHPHGAQPQAAAHRRGHRSDQRRPRPRVTRPSVGVIYFLYLGVLVLAILLLLLATWRQRRVRRHDPDGSPYPDGANGSPRPGAPAPTTSVPVGRARVPSAVPDDAAPGGTAPPPNSAAAKILAGRPAPSSGGDAPS